MRGSAKERGALPRCAFRPPRGPATPTSDRPGTASEAAACRVWRTVVSFAWGWDVPGARAVSRVVVRRVLGFLTLASRDARAQGGSIALGGSNTTPLGVKYGGIDTPQLRDGAVTNGKLANSSLTVSPGTGLTGGGSIALGGTGTLSVDQSVVQQRVSGSCSVGQSIAAIATDGTVTCAGGRVIGGT